MHPLPIRHDIRTERALAAHVSPSLLRLALEDRRWHRVTHWSATPAQPGPLAADLRSRSRSRSRRTDTRRGRPAGPEGGLGRRTAGGVTPESQPPPATADLRYTLIEPAARASMIASAAMAEHVGTFLALVALPVAIVVLAIVVYRVTGLRGRSRS